ncbi:hypothetical protein AX15_007843 [Amanita polypyramis BW_CC]|nr:hypothetical protein AX15_007843 [Amanita polypyramis BW_CC]
MECDTDNPVPDPANDAVDAYRPIVPPPLDDDHVLPAPFLRHKEKRNTVDTDEEEYGLPNNGLPLEQFPSPASDTYTPRPSPQNRPAWSSTPFGRSSSPKSVFPELDIAFPPQLRKITDRNGNIIGGELPDEWVDAMYQQVNSARLRLKAAIDDFKAEYGQALLELQRARIELEESILESQNMIERMRHLFGTKRTLEVLDIVDLGREGRLRESDLRAPDDASKDESSGYEYDDELPSNSEPYNRSWASSEPAINSNPIVPTRGAAKIRGAGNGSVAPTHDAPEIRGTRNERNKIANTSDQRDNEHRSAISHSRGSNSIRSSRKRARHEENDSEAEVELSILHDKDGGSERPSKRRNSGSIKSSASRKKRYLRGSKDERSQGREFNQRVQFEEPPKVRGLKREDAVFWTKPSPLKDRQIRGAPKSAPLVARLARDLKDEPDVLPVPKGPQSVPSHRPLRRSTSRIFPTRDGGFMYVNRTF